MRGWIAAGAAFALAAGAIAGCGSSSSGDPGTEDSGLEASDDAGETPDTGAGTDAADGSIDAKVDAGPPFCSTLSPAPKFCDDFDDGDLSGDWDIETVQGGAGELDESTWASSPASFHVKTTANVSPAIANVHLRKTVTGAATHVVLSFSTLLPSVTFTGAVAIATLDVTLNHTFRLWLLDNPADMGTAPAPNLEESYNAVLTRHVLTKLPPTNVWTRIVIDVDLTLGKATVTYDGDKALDADPITVDTGSDPTIRIGDVYVYGPNAPVEARFDNVTLDFQ